MNEIIELWKECLSAFNLESATLLSQSTHDPFRRVYCKNNRIYKLVILNREISSSLRSQDLAGEYEILKHCRGIKGVPPVFEHISKNGYEAIIMEHIHGKPLNSLNLNFIQLFPILAKLSLILFKLSLRGISHNDICQNNILVANDGTIYLIDFDQANRVNFFEAIIRQFMGIKIRGVKVHSSFAKIIKRRFKTFRKNLSAKICRLMKISIGNNQDITTLPVITDNSSLKLKTLLKAWQISQTSDASSPGKAQAYYSLDVDGYHFPGERPWTNRWEILRNITDYSGNRILELGCNMTLLSTHLLSEANASAAFAVDIDKKILEAAEQVNLAFGVKPILKCVNFDDEGDWETPLIDFKPDIVSALSVLNWIENKGRFLEFLGKFPVVIFEGHDSVEVERSRLYTVGFQHVNVVGTSERGRKIIYCCK